MIIKDLYFSNLRLIKGENKLFSSQDWQQRLKGKNEMKKQGK